MLFKQNHKVTFVMYQDQKVARAFQFDKRKLKFIFTTIPILLALSVFTILTLLIRGNKSEIEIIRPPPPSSRVLPVTPAKTSTAPKVSSQDQLENREWKDQLAHMKELNQQYKKQLSAAQMKRQAILPLFDLPQGYRNLVDQKWLRVTNIDIKFLPQKVLFHFNIINAKQNGTKLFGHIVVAMGHENRISLYPPAKVSFGQTVTSFNQGETFTISRFRRVESYFNDSLDKNSQAMFKIFIFSKTGDIIYYQTVGPVEVVKS